MVQPENQRRKRETDKVEPEGCRRDGTYECEWEDCTYASVDLKEFLNHVEQYEPHMEMRDCYSELDTPSKQPKVSKVYCCLWEGCGFSSANAKSTKFHINYHAFHIRMKEKGKLMMSEQPNLECNLESSSCNVLPPLKVGRRCEWRSCEFNTNSYQRLLDHVNTHVTGQPRRWNHQKVFCEWGKCGRINNNMTKLKSHVRTHTQEKAIACPICGVQFASKTKFIDHCVRQTQNKIYKCSYCKKNYASERILQEHIRLHVNVYKCPMCDMTCPFRFTLALHIRTRHLSSKPFKCNFCDHSASTERALKMHFQTHCSENTWVCEHCDFGCRSKNGLNAHYIKAHEYPVDEYGCHICDARYKRGAALTVHLKNKHSLRWAAGTARFRYIKDDNGVHRLQTVRYETVEVTEQFMENGNRRRSKRNKKFTCVTEAPNKLTITQDENSDSCEVSDSEEEVDDPEAIEDDEADESGSDCSRFALPPESTPNLPDSDRDSDSEFGECLRRYLGLEKGLVQVMKD